MIKICVLASGSSGNCTFVGSETTRILIDCGLSARKTAERLLEIGEQAEKIDAICVSHEHGDHIAGIRVFQKNHGTPVYANGGTLEAILRDPKQSGLTSRCFSTGSPFKIGDLTLEPFSIPHDAYEPVGFVIRTASHAVGVATDIGVVTNVIREKLRACCVVVIEANHDEMLVHQADRPWSLKQRILGNQGHLSNRAAADLMAEIAGDGLRHLFLAHLSSDCNSPQHARKAVETRLVQAGHTQVVIRLASADGVSEVVVVE
ncbi:MAG: MBL fold metallo-hydrolase [Kiritimatiellaceae bacterium]|nr:MBL fold metallo-hydrolase [Kiritimatiellaceae bacterium]